MPAGGDTTGEQDVDLDAWVERYRAHLGRVGLDVKPLTIEAQAALEQALGAPVPPVLRRVAPVYSGDLWVSDLSIDPAAAPPTVASRTLELRARGLIAPTDVVLGEPSEGLVVWRDMGADGPVIWLDAFDVERVLVAGDPPDGRPDVWPSLASFLAYVLDEEEEEARYS